MVEPLLTSALAESRDAWRALKDCATAAALPELRDAFLLSSRLRLPSYEALLAAHSRAQPSGGCQSAASVR